MLRLFLFRFWPVLLPLAVYVLWILYRQHRAKKTGAPVPGFKDGPWVWVVLSCMVLAIIGFILLGLSHQPSEGEYIPAHMENGQMVPAKVIPLEH